MSLNWQRNVARAIAWRLALVLFLALQSIPGSAQEPGSFAGVPWGATTEVVIDHHGKPDEVIQDPDFVYMYSDVNVASHTADMVFTFLDDCLVAGFYVFGDNNNTVGIFRDIDKKLTARYGRPVFQEEVWLPGASSSDGVRYIDLASGSVKLFSAWDTEGATIIHITEAAGDKIFLGVEHTLAYTDPTLLASAQAQANFFGGGL